MIRPIEMIPFTPPITINTIPPSKTQAIITISAVREKSWPSRPNSANPRRITEPLKRLLRTISICQTLSHTMFNLTLNRYDSHLTQGGKLADRPFFKKR
jgi:hypothetical protein